MIGPKLTPPTARGCDVDGCERAHYGRGFCRLHWERANKHGDPETVKAMFGATVDERLSHYSRPAGDCNVWTGHRNAGGYGQIQVNGRPRAAHRIAYELAHGPIADGLVVRHTCDNPPCIRVDHLIIGTVADNNRDKAERGRAPVVGAALRSHLDRLNMSKS